MRKQLDDVLRQIPSDPAVERVLATTFYQPRRTATESPGARLIPFPKSLRSFA